MEGLVLRSEGVPLAMTMGSFLRDDTFDVNFEKAIDPSAYPAINWEFARYLQKKYPNLSYLDREDDMGLEGLRKAKMSYMPHHMVEKSWATEFAAVSGNSLAKLRGQLPCAVFPNRNTLLCERSISLPMELRKKDPYWIL